MCNYMYMCTLYYISYTCTKTTLCMYMYMYITLMYIEFIFVDILNLFTSVEDLEDEIYTCDHCPTFKQTATKQFSIVNPPEVLRLHLKRFRYTCVHVHVHYTTYNYMYVLMLF